jgi:hypothetical protein
MTTKPELRLRKDELFRMLEYEPHPGQLLVHRSRAKRRVLACGTRFGKSTCAAMEAAAAMLEPRENALGWVVAPTLSLTDRIFKQVVQALRSRFPLRIREHSPRDHRISVINLGGGVSELKAKSADRPDGLLGEALDFLIVDESASVRDGTWGECLAPRLLDRDGWALLVSTPKGPGWFFDQYKRGRDKSDPDYECWQAPTKQNPHVDAALIEAERTRLSAEQFAEQYEAEFQGVPYEPCRSCGGPRSEVDGELTVPDGVQTDDFIPRCPACGMFVDDAGRCIVKRHNGWFAELQVDRPWCESMSFYDWYALEENGKWIGRTK